MKKADKNHFNNPDCSCTSCTYKNGLNRLSLRRIAKRSRFDRLHKHIPNKEKKLLDKLFRTRAVYDDLRARILSDSTLSSVAKPDLSLVKKSSKRDLQVENAILELVNMVDRGDDLGSKLSDCCSCCSCSSDAQVFERHVHSKTKRRSKTGRKIWRERTKFEKTREKFGDEHKRKREMRFKPKHIRSDSCTCALKFTDLIKKQSKLLVKKLRQDHSAPDMEMLQPRQMVVKRLKRIGDVIKSSYEIINEPTKHVKSVVKEGAQKLKESKELIRQSIQISAKKSLEKIKNIKHNRQNICECSEFNFQIEENLELKGTNKSMKETIVEGARKIKESKNQIEENIQIVAKRSLEKIKTARDKLSQSIKSEATALVEFGHNIAAKIKKDSINKYKEDLKKKKIKKEWTCEPECVKDVCIPEECFEKLKYKHSHKNKKGEHRKHSQLTDSRKKSSASIQSQNLSVHTITGTDMPKTSMRANQTNENYDQRFRVDAVSKKRRNELKVSPERFENENKYTKTVTSQIQKEITAESKNRQNLRNIETLGEKRLDSKHVTIERRRKTASPEQVAKSIKTKPGSEKQAVQIGSSIQFSVEFFKEKLDPSIHNPVNTKVSTPTTIRLEHRQQNIKKGLKPKLKKRHQSSQEDVKKRSSKDSQILGQPLKRCFCTLNLKSKRFKKHLRRQINTISHSRSVKGTSTNESLISGTYSNFDCNIDPSRCVNRVCDPWQCQGNAKKRSKYVSTKRDSETNGIVKFSKSGKHKKKHALRMTTKLLPYECEPGICTSGYCNPNECLRHINKRKKRKKKLKTSSSNTSQKSVSSFTSRDTTLMDTEQATEIIRNNIKPTTRSQRGRQAVKIGSSFSFNIEFHKTLASQNPEAMNYKSITLRPKTIPVTHSGGRFHKEKQIKTFLTTDTNKKYRNEKIGTTLKSFCTSKLDKKKKSKKTLKIHSAGTNTIEQGPVVKMSSKSTKINRRYFNLAQFECEPNICVPGECDLYECLERIKKRHKRKKSIGIKTISRANDSTSNTTELVKNNRSVLIQSIPKKDDKADTKMRDQKKIIIRENQAVSADSSNVNARQTVKLGSTFRFNVEFTKNHYQVKPDINIFSKRREHSEIADKRNTLKKLRNKGIENKTSKMYHIDTQADTKKLSKTLSARTTLKRCFCTLNLAKNQNQKHSFSLGRRKNVAPIVYTVNKTITANMFACYTNTKHDAHKSERSYSQNYLDTHYLKLKSTPTYSKITCEGSIQTNEHKLRKAITSKVCVILSHSNQVSNTLITWPMHLETKKIVNNLSRKLYNKNKCEIKLCRSTVVRKNIPRETLTLHDYKIFELPHYLRRCFCTMNVYTENNQMLNKDNAMTTRQLEPFECEPGICVPGQCNPYECEKLIFQRLIRTKKSGNDSISKSTSSHTKPNLSNTTNDSTQSYIERKKANPQVEYKRKKYDRIINNHKQALRVGSSFSFDIDFFKDYSKSRAKNVNPTFSSDTKLAKPVKQKIKKNKISSTQRYKGSFDDQESQSESFTAPKESDAQPVMKHCFCTLKLQKQGKLHKEKLTNMNIERNPYRCVQVIEKKLQSQGKNAATNTIYSGHSVYVSTKNRKTREKHRAISVKRKSVTKKIERKIADAKKLKPQRKENNISTISRQAMHIGSSFSFNSEFFKDKSHLPKCKERFEVGPEPQKYTKEQFSPNIRYKKLEHKGSQAQTSLKRDKELQIMSNFPARPTMTDSFLKRCFCTAKVQKKHLLKLPKEKRKQKLDTRPEKSLTAEKEMNTQLKTPLLTLKPYECLPGICTPGACDPYKFYEIMQKERIQTCSTGSSTNSVKTRTLGSYDPGILSENRNTQLKPTSAPKGFGPKTHFNTLHLHEHAGGSNKQAAKIGSSFNFDIEFFKQKNFTFDNPYSYSLPLISKIKYSEELNSFQPEKKKRKIKHTKSDSRSISFSSSPTQVLHEKIKNADVKVHSLLKRCICVLKLQSKRRKREKNSKIRDMEPKHNISTKDALAVNAKSQSNLLPNECEPNVCVPYECDTIGCKKFIKKRLKKERYRQSSTATNMGNISRSVFTNTCLAPKTKNRYTIKNSKNVSVKLKPPKIKTYQFSSQSRQSIKIGSNFNFNIKFFKNRTGFKVTKLPKRTNLEIKELPAPEKQHLGSQYHRSFKDSKIKFGKELVKTQSTMTRNFPDSNRCFCTLYLKKVEREKEKQLYVKNITNTTDASAEANIKLLKLKLLPYECEPNICIPGECNPLECYEKIKLRENKKRNVGLTTRYRKRSIGSVVSGESAKLVNKNLQIKLHQKSDSPTYEVTKSANSNHKQGVRIGSNFSFNIEFYKDRIKNNNLIKLSNQKHNKKKYNSLDNVSIVKHPKNKKNSDKKLQNINPVRHSNTQVHKKATQSVKNGVPALLKRCFCTLMSHQRKIYFKKDDSSNSEKKQKLLKAEKRQYSKMRSNSSSLTQTGKGLNTEKHLVLPNLKPYECEPGECDPSECKKRIRRRFLSAFSTQTDRPTKDFSTNLNNKVVSRSIKIQSKRNAYENVKPEKESMKSTWQSKRVIPSYCVSNNTHRQAVHIRSKFGFDIDFFKDIKGSPPLKHNTPVNEKRKGRTKKENIQFKHKPNCRHQKAQSSYGKTKFQSSSISPKLEKCFCTLKLHKPKNNKFRNVTDNLSRVSDTSRNEGVTAKINPTYSRNLKPYECEPCTCIPGECDPYGCGKRIQMRFLHNTQDISTQVVKHYRPISVGIHPEHLKTQIIQADIVDSAQSKIVEEPRFLNIGQNAVQIGSNVRFNIEFYKETLTPAVVVATENKIKDTENFVRVKQSHNADKDILANAGLKKSRKSQGNTVLRDTKASDRGNMLKRCFCTLRLHKNNTSKHKGNKQLNVFPVLINNIFPQAFDVRRVTIKKKSRQIKTIDAKMESVATNISRKYMCDCPGERKRNTGEIYTIFPYASNKFNKTVSKTLLPKNEIQKKRKTTLGNKKRLTRKKSIKSQNNLHDQSLMQNTIQPDNNNQKSLLCRCINLFKKQSPGLLFSDISENKNNVRYCGSATCQYLSLINSDNYRHQERLQSKNKHKRYKMRQKRKPIAHKNKIVSGSVPQAGNSHSNKQVDEKIKGIPKTTKKDRSPIVNDSNLCAHCTKLQLLKPKKVRFLDKSKSCDYCDICGRDINKEELRKAAGDLLHTAGKYSSNLIQIPPKYSLDRAQSVEKYTSNFEKTPSKYPSKQGKVAKISNRVRSVSKYRSDRLQTDEKISSDRPQSDIKKPSKLSHKCKKKSSKRLMTRYKKSFDRSRIHDETSIDLEQAVITKLTSYPRKDNAKSDNPQTDYKKSPNRPQTNRKKSRDNLQDYNNKTSDHPQKGNKKNSFLSKNTKKTDHPLTDIKKHTVLAMLVSAKNTIKKLFGFGGNENVCSGDKFRQPLFEVELDSEGYYVINKDEVAHSLTKLKQKTKKEERKGKKIEGKHCKTCGCCICEHKRRKTEFASAATRYAVSAVARNKNIKLPPEERERERFDFSCNLYMASLRKRPFLCIYDRCPWFYQHFISLVNVWRQFTDILLYLLAAVFWSPCILAIELCRALLCCLVCTH